MARLYNLFLHFHSVLLSTAFIITILVRVINVILCSIGIDKSVELCQPESFELLLRGTLSPVTLSTSSSIYEFLSQFGFIEFRSIFHWSRSKTSFLPKVIETKDTLCLLRSSREEMQYVRTVTRNSFWLWERSTHAVQS